MEMVPERIVGSPAHTDPGPRDQQQTRGLPRLVGLPSHAPE